MLENCILEFFTLSINSLLNTPSWEQACQSNDYEKTNKIRKYGKMEREFLKEYLKNVVAVKDNLFSK